MLFERIVKQALEQENVGLLTNAGYAFENGIGYAQDYAMAHRFYIVAAQYGDDQAVNNLGWLTLNGFGVKKDVEKAAELFRKAADMGNSTAMVNLGNLYEDGIPDGETDYTQAIIWYKKAADKGDETGMFNYANCLHHGWGTRKNRKKAFAIFEGLVDWFDQDETNPDVCFYLGLYYQEGCAVPRDYTKALEWYEIGAEQEHAFCINQLGVMHAKGLGVPKDPKKAMRYYQQAAALGDTLACANVGWLYESVKEFRNMDKAVKWYRKGAQEDEEHCIEALHRLGNDTTEESIFD